MTKPSRPVDEINPVGRDAECLECVALAGEGLFVDRAACVSDQRSGHLQRLSDSPRLLRIVSYEPCETAAPLVGCCWRRRCGAYGWGTLIGRRSHGCIEPLHTREVITQPPARNRRRSPWRQRCSNVRTGSALVAQMLVRQNATSRRADCGERPTVDAHDHLTGNRRTGLVECNKRWRVHPERT
jgi:hypothetical protein